MEELKADVKEIKAKVDAMALVLAVNTEALVQHSARTTANETRIVQMEKYLLGLMASVVVALLALVLKN